MCGDVAASNAAQQIESSAHDGTGSGGAVQLSWNKFLRSHIGISSKYSHQATVPMAAASTLPDIVCARQTSEFHSDVHFVCPLDHNNNQADSSCELNLSNANTNASAHWLQFVALRTVYMAK